jgi:hypothetical protein
MLEPSTRTIFFDMLRPPEGYELHEGIATTYSLDLVTLLTAPLAFTAFEYSDTEGKPTADPVLLLEALRRNADKLTVFCQAGRAMAPAQQGILYSYLEKMVVEVTAPLGGVFHPKLWLLRFDGEGHPIVRLVILSRNLTGDRCWDISLVMDGEISDRKKGFGAHAPFADFIQGLPALGIHPQDAVILERAKRLADDMRRADFSPPDGFNTYSFIPLGLKKTRKLPFFEKRKRILVVSPFLTRAFLDNLTDGTDGHILVSRIDELAKLPSAALEPFDQIYTLAEAAQSLECGDEETKTTDTTLTGLHAKLYLIDEGWDSTLYIGSANATSAGFSKNVEILVGLTGKRSQVGIDQVMHGSDGQASFLSLLVPYTPPDTPVEPDAIEEELEGRLDEFRLAIATAGLRVVVDEIKGQYTLRLTGTESVSITEGVSASLWPITVPEKANARTLASGESLAFGPLPLAAVTAFFGVAARATAQGVSVDARFVLPLPLDNAPSGRREAILGALLDDPEKFLRFLQFLLGDLDDLGPLPTGNDRLDGSSYGSWRSSSFVLFESLLRALNEDPRRLDYVASTVTEVLTTPNGKERLPLGFMPIWEAVWAARKDLVS